MSESMAATDLCNSTESQEWVGREAARLVMLQFSIDQMALEVFMLCGNVANINCSALLHMNMITM
jgi:hypothetical protein